MEALLITIIAAILFGLDVVSVHAFLAIALLGIVWMFVGMTLYFRFGFLKIYYHDFLGWHTPDDSPQYSDGCSQHARCKHCGKDIMQDSQGNWFTFD